MAGWLISLAIWLSTSHITDSDDSACTYSKFAVAAADSGAMHWVIAQLSHSHTELWLAGDIFVTFSMFVFLHSFARSLSLYLGSPFFLFSVWCVESLDSFARSFVPFRQLLWQLIWLLYRLVSVTVAHANAFCLFMNPDRMCAWIVSVREDEKRTWNAFNKMYKHLLI